MPSLDQFLPGQRGCITAIQGDDALGQRLMEMGLLEGQVFEVLRLAPLGGPMEILLGDYRLSLRRSEAARALVEESED